MKLAPREHRVRADYLLDNAAALNIGRLFLGWGKKKRTKGKAKADRTAENSAAKKSKVTPTPEAAAKKSPRTPVKKTAQAKSSSPNRSSQPPAPTAEAAPTTKFAGLPRKHAPQQPASKVGGKRSPARPAPKTAAKPRKAVLPSTPLPAAPPQQSKPAPHPPAAAPTTKSVAQRRPRRPALPPVIPNPVPTPALPAYSPSNPVENVDGSQMVTITVRTMNGSSFRLILTADTILYELKRQILGVIAPGPAPRNAPQRLPMLVMNGRALMPDNATLRALRFTTLSTVYCFPEPN